MLYTHTCGQLKKDDVGKKVTLCGWVHSRRDHGKLIFIDLRDRFGIIQAVFNPKENGQAYKKAEALRSEYLILLEGKVAARPKGTQNPKIPTGEVEIIASNLDILNSSLELPFEIAEYKEIGEDLRLKYRYLDMRRGKVLQNFILRHRLYQIIRNFLDKENFLEIDTPILTKSTPEGARDYLVPSRLSPGRFFALPQSPQLFKQILMVAGIMRYFQIAKCFRDEDLRADRQPEFMQLDLEMAFVDESDIFNLCERLIYKIFKEIMNINIEIPFPRLIFKDAVDKYKTDKPDLRKDKEGFKFVWIIDFPLFKYNEEESRWESEHHPFTAPNEDDLQLLKKSPDRVRARSYDLVLNGAEIASGSIRIHKADLQKKIFDIIKLDEKQAQERFGFLLQAFKYGAPPHGGIAFGLDRIVAILSGEDSIREVIAFPKTQKAICPLTGAPSEVGARQLKELGIRIS